MAKKSKSKQKKYFLESFLLTQEIIICFDKQYISHKFRTGIYNTGQKNLLNHSARSLH